MTTFLKDFKIPLILIAEIIICLALSDEISMSIRSLFYAISLSMKEILLFVLPFIIFSFLMYSIGSLKNGAFSYIALVFSLIVASNFIATMLGGSLGMLTIETLGLVAPVVTTSDGLTAAWKLRLDPLVSNDIAMVLGLVSGLIVSLAKNRSGQRFARIAHDFSMIFLKQCFIPVLPIFILGFIFKLESDGVLESVFTHYLPIAGIVVIAAVAYLLLILWYACDFKWHAVKRCVKNLSPAMLTGFTTMSSASTMPLILTAVEKNTSDDSTPGVVPISVNAHLVGDCFSMSMQAIAILVSFGMGQPDINTFLLFAVFFVIARFAVAGVPGGGVLMTLPVFQSYLGFSGEMLSLITALYILFDPLMTPINALGHGTFAQLFEKLYRKRRTPKTIKS